jgi:hypothetical protein
LSSHCMMRKISTVPFLVGISMLMQYTKVKDGVRL